MNSEFIADVAVQEKKDSLKADAFVRPLSINVAIIQAAYLKEKAQPSAVSVDLKDVVEGIRKYQMHPFKRPPSKRCETVYSSGALELHYFKAKTKAHKVERSIPAMVIVPSLINKSYILDLAQGASFADWFAAQGCDVYVVDWGDLCADSKMHDMDDLVRDRLLLALQYVAGKHTNVFAAGYCLGGTILAHGAPSLFPHLKGSIFLASPFDFHAGDRTLATKINNTKAQADQLIERHGYLPSSWIQTVFSVMNMKYSLQKFASFAACEQGSAAEQKFVMVEDWLNDGVDLPGALAQKCVHDWYGDNQLAEKARQNNVRYDLPSLIVASTQDKIVPMESAIAMGALMHNHKIMSCRKGHVGMMSGQGADEAVWKPILNWMIERTE
jgi:polyhydroxyalkanoate synthase